MTPAELRRRAYQKQSEADALASDAIELRAQAAALRGLLEPLAAMSARVWVGPAADDFEAKARTASHTVNEQADRLLRVAAELDDRAGSLRSQAWSLRTQADVAEAAAAAPPVPNGVS